MYFYNNNIEVNLTQNIICITLFLKFFALDDDIHVLPKDPNEIMYFEETGGRNTDEEHFLEPGIFFLTYGASPSLLLAGISITILRERLLMDVGEIVAFFTSLWV